MGQTRSEYQPDAKCGWARSGSLSKWTRSAKTLLRLPAILYGLARSYDGTWYFCLKTTQGVLQRALAHLSEPARRKCSLVELPL